MASSAVGRRAAILGQVLDASVHGLCVVPSSMPPLDVGKVCRVEILYGREREVRFVGRVRRIAEGGIGIETDESLPLSDYPAVDDVPGGTTR